MQKETDPLRRTTRFRRHLLSPDLVFACEAHSGLSAKVVEEAGFDAIWASGLAIAAQFGVRDNNEASWTQVLDVVEFMADASRVPIIVDGDTGYGNFNNVQRLVRKLEQRGAAAVCIEDKLFPKTNSFIDSRRQPLADIDEFAGRIAAAKDAQLDPDFSVVARIEALVAGWGQAEALQRADVYHRAGADAILIHSAQATADEVVAFKQEWGGRCPVVIVPTKYYRTPVEVYRAHQFSMVIWANHLLRSSLHAMQHTAAALRRAESPVDIEPGIARLDEVFRLQQADVLREAEGRYLPAGQAAPTAVVLAAGAGTLGPLTAERPNAMVPVGGVPILGHAVSAFHRAGMRDIVVVRGYCKAAFDLPNLTYADNDAFADTGELVSLRCGLAAASLGHGVVVCYGDVLFRKFILDLLRDSDSDFTIVVDTEWRESSNRNRVADYVHCSMPPSRGHFNRTITLQQVSTDLPASDRHGEWMGFLRIAPRGMQVALDVLDGILAQAEHRRAAMPALLNGLVAAGHEVRVIYTSGNWCDVDSLDDVMAGQTF